MSHVPSDTRVRGHGHKALSLYPPHPLPSTVSTAAAAVFVSGTPCHVIGRLLAGAQNFLAGPEPQDQPPSSGVAT